MQPPALRATPDNPLDQLFPQGVSTALSAAPETGDVAALSAEEEACAARFAPVRLAEFRHGRSCARLALRRLGSSLGGGIPVGAHREPLWPQGIVGSISHARPAAAAAVGWASQFLAIGLDIEHREPLDAELRDRICRPTELRLCEAAGWPDGDAEKLVFSAKEAAYKALWPLIRHFLDFHDLELAIDYAGGSFSVISRSAHCPAEIAAGLEGRFGIVDDLIATGVAIRRGSL